MLSLIDLAAPIGITTDAVEKLLTAALTPTLTRSLNTREDDILSIELKLIITTRLYNQVSSLKVTYDLVNLEYIPLSEWREFLSDSYCSYLTVNRSAGETTLWRKGPEVEIRNSHFHGDSDCGNLSVTFPCSLLEPVIQEVVEMLESNGY